MFSRPKPMAHSLYPILWPDLEKAQFWVKIRGCWRRSQSSANSSQKASSLFYGKIQGNSSISSLKSPRHPGFRHKIQSLANRIP
jgi:hypothetical protein